jgi:hypothetical protein
MLPNFLIEETTVRESGESAVFDASKNLTPNLLLILGITHAVEHESIGIDILGSTDGMVWSSRPLVTFTPKSYCGIYKLVVPTAETPYLKAVWRPQRWSRADHRPFFRFYLLAEPARERVLAASAA